MVFLGPVNKFKNRNRLHPAKYTIRCLWDLVM